MQVECWIDSAEVPNVSIVLTFGLTSNEDTSPCSPTLGGGTALAAACQGCTASEVLVLFISVHLRVAGGHGGPAQSSALSPQSYQICAPDNIRYIYTILREYIICTRYKAVMYKCMCIQ